jgi:HEAT repeat protein
MPRGPEIPKPDYSLEEYDALMEARFPPRDRRGLLSLAVDAESNWIRIGALQTLRKVADATMLPELIELSEDDDLSLRLHALVVIARIPDAEATRVLTSAIMDPEPVISAWAVVWLSKRDAMSADLAVALLDSEHSMVRRAAVKALAHSRDRSTVAPLRRLARKERGSLRLAAALASVRVATRGARGDRPPTQ